MNLWFRLLKMLLRRPWRKPVGGMETTVIKMRVWPTDLDFNLHVTNGRYFTMADVGRMDYVLRSGAYKVALRHKALPIVGDVWGKFRRELRLFESFEIHTRMLGWDHKWVLMEHRFIRKDRLMGVVIMRGLFRSPDGLVDPQEFIADMQLQPESPAIPAWLNNWANSCDTLTEQLRNDDIVRS